MTRNRKLLLAGTSAAVLAAGGVGIAQAMGGDSEEQATGPAADRAKHAALEAVRGGRVVGVEREDDGEAGWEVEIVRRDGQQLEVHLTPAFDPAGLERDDDGAGDHDERGEHDD